MQSQIWHREAKEIHTNGGFTVYPGLLVTDQRVAIKMSQKKPALTEAGKHFGRVSILLLFNALVDQRIFSFAEDTSACVSMGLFR
jgi:hypothetical protein